MSSEWLGTSHMVGLEMPVLVMFFMRVRAKAFHLARTNDRPCFGPLKALRGVAWILFDSGTRGVGTLISGWIEAKEALAISVFTVS